MKCLRLLLITALLLLPACASQNIQQVLDNLSKDCTRHYTFSAASGVPAQATIAGTIDCAPMQGVAGGVTTAPVKP